MVANLPYNVGTPLVLEILRQVPEVARLLVMVQREVAGRFLAAPGSRAYGIPSIVVALHADARLVFTVPREVFYPMPNVESALVDLTRREPSPWAGRAIELAREAFRQRRKMLRRSLAAALDDPPAVLARAGIAETARPEDLSPSDFLGLAEAVW
jgi:16S rRNA (adenine1518-N6/adenine1519-N6)-dimethyltransferase